MITLKRHLVVAALTAGMAAFAHAGPITWSAATNVSGVGDVSTSGSLVEAFNLTSAGPGTTTVNGVTFTNTDALLSSSPVNQNFLAGNTTGNAAYDALLNGLDFGNGNPFTLLIGNGLLSVGARYELQVWYADIRPTFEGRTMSYGSSATDLVVLSSTGTNLGTARLGQFAIGTFTATGTSQNLYMATNGFANVHLSGYQIRELPEPGSLLLVAVALLGLGMARRPKV